VVHDGFVRITSLTVFQTKRMINCRLRVHCILDLHAEFLDRNAFLFSFSYVFHALDNCAFCRTNNRNAYIYIFIYNVNNLRLLAQVHMSGQHTHGIIRYILKTDVFSDITLCTLVDRYYCFEGTCCPHLQGRRIPWKWTHYVSPKCWHLHTIPYNVT